MPVVRVYVPAAAWRDLEQRGDPAALVRAMVAAQLAPGTPKARNDPEPRKPAAPETRPGRAHMKRNRPAIQCPGRTFVNGACTECGAPE